MPLITTLANASARGYGGLRTFGAANSYESIATVTVGSGGSSTITFSSIPSTYTHLQIRAITRSTRSAANSNIYLGFNNDTTTGNYYGHYLNGDGSSAGAGAKIGSTTSAIIVSAAATSTSSVFTGAVIDILDYANTNKYKTIRGLDGRDLNGSGQVAITSALWAYTNAVDRIELKPFNGNFAQYSHFALYGIRSA